MRKFRKPIRENTRKISASKFLNQPESANIEQIKTLTGSILETLKRQEKFEYEQFLDLQRRYENEKRRKREEKLEGTGKGLKSFLKGRAKKIAAPLLGFLQRILGFILTIFLGRALVKLLQFLADPKNIAIVEKIGDFFSSKFGFITAGIVAFGIAATSLMATIVGLTGRLLLSSVLGGGSGLGFLGNLRKLLPGFSKKVPITTNIGKPIRRGFRFPRIRFNQGGVVPGIGNQDTVPAMLTPGEFVVKKNVVGVLGLPFFERLNRSFSQLKNFYNQGRNVRFPNENAAKLKDLIKDDFSQITRTDKAFKEGAKGLKGARPLKAFTPRMMKTGPTPLTRQMIERPVRTMFGTTVSGFAKRLPILDLLLDLAFPKPLADGTLTGNSAEISGGNFNPVPNLLPMDVNSVSKTSLPNFGDLPPIPEPDQSTDIRNDIIDVSLNSPSVEKMETLGMMQ